MTRFEANNGLEAPDEPTRIRMEEVKFWIVFHRFYSFTNSVISPLNDEFSRIICQITHVPQSVFSELQRDYHKKSVRPNKREISLCLRWMGFSYQGINDVSGIAKNTAKKYVDEYIREGHPTIPPKIVAVGYWDLVEDAMKPIYLWLSMSHGALAIAKDEVPKLHN